MAGRVGIAVAAEIVAMAVGAGLAAVGTAWSVVLRFGMFDR